VCRNGLLSCATAEEQAPWLRRYLAARAHAASSRGAANLGGVPRTACRACAATGADVAAAGGKLRFCTACRAVAYCGAACQRADWRRHAPACKAAAAAAGGATDIADEDAATAQLSETLCACCRSSLLATDGGLVEILRCGHPLHARCTAALRSSMAGSSSALCPTCSAPFCVPLSVVSHGADGATHLHDRARVDAEIAAARAAGAWTDAESVPGGDMLRKFGIVGWMPAPQ
jgi:hypothetical protein